MHLTYAKEQRSLIKTILKDSAKEVLKSDRDANSAIEEFDACIDKLVCNHELDTPSSDLLISTAEDMILNEVSSQK